MATFKELWDNIPFVTKWCSLTSIILLFLLSAFSSLKLKLWYFPGFMPRWQIWRPFCSTFSTAEQGLNALITIFMFPLNLQQLETQIFGSRGRMAFYLTCIAGWFMFWGPRFGIYAWLSGINMAMSWTLSQEDPFGQTQIIILTVPRMYVPLLQLAIAFLLNGPLGLIEPAMAYLVAHLFMFLTEFVPDCGGPSILRNTPKVFTYLDKMEENARRAKVLGKGKKLGRT